MGLVPGVVAESADVEVVPRLGSAGGQIDLCAWDDILDRAMTSALVVARPEETLYVRWLSESVRWRSAIARAASFRDCSFPEEAAAAPRLCRKCLLTAAYLFLTKPIRRGFSRQIAHAAGVTPQFVAYLESVSPDLGPDLLEEPAGLIPKKYRMVCTSRTRTFQNRPSSFPPEGPVESRGSSSHGSRGRRPARAPASWPVRQPGERAPLLKRLVSLGHRSQQGQHGADLRDDDRSRTQRVLHLGTCDPALRSPSNMTMRAGSP